MENVLLSRLCRIFQTRHGSEIQCVSVSDAEPDIARIQKARDGVLPGGSSIFFFY